MTTPLLKTKLYTPSPRANLVRRPHLIERLKAGLDSRLTLVSAPAGFGKTTLVTEWLNSAGRPFTWLSLDENDNDPARFLTYLVAALQRIDPAVGQAAQAMLQAPQPPSPEALHPPDSPAWVTQVHPFVCYTRRKGGRSSADAIGRPPRHRDPPTRRQDRQVGPLHRHLPHWPRHSSRQNRRALRLGPLHHHAPIPPHTLHPSLLPTLAIPAQYPSLTAER